MSSAQSESLDVDVLVVGAGIAGVGGAYHLTQQCANKTFVVLESQSDFGGTWRTHTYPGVRSDSDLYTFGYRFKPWMGAPIATAEEILKYMGEVIEEHDLAKHIRYNHRIESASWNSVKKRWTIAATRTDTGATLCVQAKFLWMCSGYYRHSEGYTPKWEGMENFAGLIVHPQLWPKDLDVNGKRVVVIGSGATAATLVPAIAEETAHTTMLQRSPTYFVTGRNANELADQLRALAIDPMWIHEIVRRKILADGQAITALSFSDPDFLRTELLNGVKAILGDDYPVEKHFSPSYRPWRQRIAFVPNGDFFHAIKDGKASVVTDEIDSFTTKGILLKSGETLEADIIVTATGFDLNVLGDISITIDDKQLDFSDTVTFHGTMFTGVPNMAWVFGYFRASWTLRADLIADFVCRLLHHMDEAGVEVVTPTLSDADASMKLLPWVDPENFNPGYIMRGVHLLPKQGDHAPWLHTQDYHSEKDILPTVDLTSDALRYSPSV
jgi:cation diffusion facilitator CzcD-associated flavoprotein CzcO